MTVSIYIVGGAGTGKSTFMAKLLDEMILNYGPLEDLHARRNTKALVTLRGHRMNTYAGREVLYLGCLRENFPGTDGLDRASSATGVEWLQTHQLPEFIIGEGATLATRPFLTELAARTSLLFIHLHAEDFVKELRFAERGSNQDERFVMATATRSENLLRDLQGATETISVDTSEPWSWDAAFQRACDYLT